MFYKIFHLLKFLVFLPITIYADFGLPLVSLVKRPSFNLTNMNVYRMALKIFFIVVLMRPTLALFNPFTSSHFQTSWFGLRSTHKIFMWDCTTSLFEDHGYVMLNLRPCLAVWRTVCSR